MHSVKRLQLLSFLQLFYSLLLHPTNYSIAKGALISGRISIFVQSSKKNHKIVVHQLFPLQIKITNSDFVHFFEDGTKMKIPSEIYSPLIPLVTLTINRHQTLFILLGQDITLYILILIFTYIYITNIF